MYRDFRGTLNFINRISITKVMLKNMLITNSKNAVSRSQDVVGRDDGSAAVYVAQSRIHQCSLPGNGVGICLTSTENPVRRGITAVESHACFGT